MQTISFRRGVPGDASVLTTFAAHLFREAFSAENDPADLEAYIADAFTIDRQRSELGDPGGAVILAEEGAADDDDTGAALVGYAHVVSGETPVGAGGARALELKRFYVAPAWQGTGVAQALMGEVIGVASERKVEVLWLGVWEHNHRAIAFYRKHGFKRFGEHTFLLGGDAQTDHLMSRPVGGSDGNSEVDFDRRRLAR